MPRIFLAATAALTFAGLAYIVDADIDTPSAWGDQRSRAELRAPVRSTSAAAADGAALFASRCVACHQVSGLGLPGIFPPLAGSEWVKGDPTRLAMLVLNGVIGSLDVKGQTFNGAMPAFKSQLSDAELAALLSHVRSQWGNASTPVGADVVSAARARTQTRSAPFNGNAELAVPR